MAGLTKDRSCAVRKNNIILYKDFGAKLRVCEICGTTNLSQMNRVLQGMLK